MMRKDETPLLADPESPSYGAASAGPNALDRTWSSFQEGRRLSAVTSKNASFDKKHPIRVKEKKTRKGFDHYVYCVIYAIVNVIISAPGLYGYTAVIFNNPVFDNHMNALSKLVIFSSLIHQLGFFLFSTLDFAIGTVQDAGLIFLSAMANKIANRMLEDGHGEDEVLSTTIVLLCLGTACLGLVLILMGRFRLADAVAYLPMPVVVSKYIPRTSVEVLRLASAYLSLIFSLFAVLVITGRVLSLYWIFLLSSRSCTVYFKTYDDARRLEIHV
jgi:hypothetical protein